MENEVNLPFMMSLYDYLGRAAGGALGAAVYTTAKALKETISTSKVSNPKYEGNIMMYRREFLDEYFGNKVYDGVERK
jgi:hypothetical protein